MSSPPPLDVLVPTSSGRESREILPDPAEVELTALYGAPAGGLARANMIATVDGATAGPDGRSGSINGPADLRVFTTLRALADVVLVGAGTARTEGYGAPRTPLPLRSGRRARGQRDHPDLALVTRSGLLPAELLVEDPAPWVFTTGRAPGLDELRRALPAERLHVHDDEVDLGEALRTLRAAGRTSVLAEGGPALLGALVRRGLVGELCLTTSPVLVGSPVGILGPGSELAPPRPGALAHLLHAEGVLLARWLLGTPASSVQPAVAP
ncbi:dihydrofolate reductase family protein [Actinotalea sp. BY-33]|uniref:Dihydrofolate reductase family protein n=1 Tax=Actinotalea soli TaxID=2819234 RepID=A0A939LMQ8_9CELL|nr:dihydrofolate reductase family protein [Actinotalea soli]MBO1750531.1 dihydrofolate reductase family protein [Actinotalea soli]